MKPTPHHQHVRRVYSKMKDLRGSETLIIFRIDDHYELYFDDALTASPLLDIGLSGAAVPLLRFPESELEQNTDKLTSAGHGICVSQMHDGSGEYVLDTYIRRSAPSEITGNAGHAPRISGLNTKRHGRK